MFTFYLYSIEKRLRMRVPRHVTTTLILLNLTFFNTHRTLQSHSCVIVSLLNSNVHNKRSLYRLIETECVIVFLLSLIISSV